MKFEGDCPDCEESLGVAIDDSVASMMGSTIERFMDRDGNRMYCQECGEYKEPDGVEIVEE